MVYHTRNSEDRRGNVTRDRRAKYPTYLASAKWKRRRLHFLKQAGHKCQHCGATERLQVHHRHYNSLGREAWADVVVLCGRCHGLEHTTGGIEKAISKSCFYVSYR